MIQILGHDCGVALDTSHHPVVITTWYGAPTSDLVDDYVTWRDATSAEAMAAEQQLVYVIDLRRAARPSGLVRKRLLEHSRNDIAAEVRLATFAVAEPDLGALVRAAGRAHKQPPSIVPTIEQAILMALTALRAARIPVPRGLTPEGYRTPRLAS